MQLSHRVQDLSESLTLKLNALATSMAEEGKEVYNLTAGQLPFRPPNDFSHLSRSDLDFLRSYQYSPVPGYPELKKKFLSHFEQTRDVSLASLEDKFGCVIGNGAKHSLSTLFTCLLNEGDEVVMMAPYWVSYPEMVKLYGGVPKVIDTTPFDVFVPDLGDIEKAINSKTKAIILNSPNNPSGTHYSDEWMKDFADLMSKHPDVLIVSDEIYYQLYYYDPKPTFFYQHKPELLKQTVIVDGISKTLASTGLRLGYALGPEKIIKMMGKVQGQTTSGANSLVQRALIGYDLKLMENFLSPIKKHLRDNATEIREIFKEANLSHTWYQSTSAFYYLMDFSQTPVMESYKSGVGDSEDYSLKICEDLLEKKGVAVVPGAAFGMPNTARMSLVLEREPFKEALKRIVTFMQN